MLMWTWWWVGERHCLVSGAPWVVFVSHPLAQLINGSHGFDDDLCLSLRLQSSS